MRQLLVLIFGLILSGSHDASHHAYLLDEVRAPLIDKVPLHPRKVVVVASSQFFIDDKKVSWEEFRDHAGPVTEVQVNDQLEVIKIKATSKK